MTMLSLLTANLVVVNLKNKRKCYIQYYRGWYDVGQFKKRGFWNFEIGGEVKEKL
jgi:hypothetical protein